MKKFGVLFILLAMVACASDDDKKSDNTDKADKPAVVKTDNLICPQVAILQEAQEVVDYGGEKPDPSQIVAKARMGTVQGDCAYRDNGIDITFTVHMMALKGPRIGQQISFPYFVAIVDPSENIIDRQIMTAQFKFSDSDKGKTDDEDMHIFIPLTKAAQLAGPDYRVLLGFKIAKTQTKY